MAGRRYYRISPAVWLEPWDDDARLAAFYILTSEHRTLEGLFRMPLSYAAEDLGWPAKRFEKAFATLERHGFVEYDRGAKVCLIVNALKWQGPSNPNQVKAAVKAIRELPPTELTDRFRTLVATHCERLAEALAEQLPEQFGRPFAERSGNAVANTPAPAPTLNPPNPPPAGGALIELPPKGGRKRDQDRWEASVSAAAQRLFPDADQRAAAECVRRAATLGKTSDTEITEFAGQWWPQLTGGAA